MKKVLLVTFLGLFFSSTSSQILDIGDTVKIPTKSGLIAYYPFNGNANDESTNTNNGTILGPTLTTDRFGNPNSAYHFNGTSDYIRVPDHTSLRPSNGITVSAWVNAEDFSSWNMIVCKRYRHSSFPYNSYLLYAAGTAGAPQNWGFGVSGSSADKYAVSSNLIDTNKWVHVLGTYDRSLNDSNVKLYVDGSLIKVEDASFLIGYTDSALRIGMAIPGPSKQHFKGKIDDVRIYDRALCEREIKLLLDSTKVISVAQSNTSICGLSSSEYVELFNPQPDIEYTLVKFSDSSAVGSTFTGNCVDSSIRFGIGGITQTTSFLIKAKRGSATKYLDSVFKIVVYPQYNLTIDTLICGADSIFFDSKWIDTTSSTVGFFKTTHNCDSNVTLNVTKQYPDLYYDTVSICDEDSIFLAKGFRKNAGTFYDTVPRVNICDSILVTTLNIIFPDTFNFQVSICENDSFLTGGKYQTQTGVYYDTISRLNACDSIRITDLTVLLPDTFNFQQFICEGDSSFIEGAYQKQAGTYYDTITRVNACDSIRVISLVVNSLDSTYDTLEICLGDSIQIINTFRKTAGVYRDTLKNSNNCDSIIISTLNILQPSSSSQTIDICFGDSAFAGGVYRKQAGIYYDTLTSTNSCDSVVETNLTVKNFINSSAGNLNICSGDSLLFRGVYYKVSGNYSDTVFANGCIDSIYSVSLTVNSPITTTENLQVCVGGFIIVNNDSIFNSGNYVDSLKTINGCDSFVQINLVIGGYIEMDDTLSYCAGDSLLFNGIYFTNDTIIYDTLNQFVGCDTVLETSILSIKNSLSLPDTVFICENDTLISIGSYDEYLWSSGNTSSNIIIGDTGIYWVRVKQNNCFFYDSTLVIENCGPTIYFPTSFSPNGDGLNDEFYLTTNNVSKLNYKLFNTWGELIFETDDTHFKWKGEYKNRPIPTGSYIWICSFEGYGTNKKLIKDNDKGILTIIR